MFKRLAVLLFTAVALSVTNAPAASKTKEDCDTLYQTLTQTMSDMYQAWYDYDQDHTYFHDVGEGAYMQATSVCPSACWDGNNCHMITWDNWVACNTCSANATGQATADGAGHTQCGYGNSAADWGDGDRNEGNDYYNAFNYDACWNCWIDAGSHYTYAIGYYNTAHTNISTAIGCCETICGCHDSGFCSGFAF